MITSVALVAVGAISINCYPAAQILSGLLEKGYSVVYGGTTEGKVVATFEDGQGNWFVIGLSGDIACVFAAGEDGYYLKPEKKEGTVN